MVGFSTPRRTAACCVLLLLGVTAMPTLGATAVDVYAQSAAGTSILGAAGPPFSCATFGPDPRNARYGGGYRVSLPSDGAVCGVAEDVHALEAGGGTVAVASTLPVSFGSSADPRSFVGAAAARADFASMGVAAAASYTGTTDGFTVAGSGAGARQVDVLTIGGGAGNGTFKPTFTIDGSLFGVGRSDTEITFSYRVAGIGPFLAFRIQNSRGALSYYANGGYVATLPGMSTTGDLATGFRVSGSTTVTLAIPFTFGTPLDLDFALWAGVLPSSNVQLLTPSAGEVQFLASARMTGIEVLDAAGTALPDFVISAESGALYGPGGVSLVPEAPSAALLAAGLAALALRLRRRG